MTLHLAAAAFFVSLTALALVWDERQRNQHRADVANSNTQTLLDIDEGQERRLSVLETYCYSGGAIDQRRGKDGVWE